MSQVLRMLPLHPYSFPSRGSPHCNQQWPGRNLEGDGLTSGCGAKAAFLLGNCCLASRQVVYHELHECFRTMGLEKTVE